MLKTLTLRPGDKLLRYTDKRGKLIWETEYGRVIKQVKDACGAFCTCCYCGKILNRRQMTADHLIPLSRGGETVPSNLAICCADCNLEKGSMTVEEYLRFKNTQVPPPPPTSELTYAKLINIKDISIPSMFKRCPPSTDKVRKERAFIKEYKRLRKPLQIFSRNDSTLTDGYTRYLAAIEMQLLEVPIDFKYKL